MGNNFRCGVLYVTPASGSIATRAQPLAMRKASLLSERRTMRELFITNADSNYRSPLSDYATIQGQADLGLYVAKSRRISGSRPTGTVTTA